VIPFICVYYTAYKYTYQVKKQGFDKWHLI
jgi:hypothetical protein